MYFILHKNKNNINIAKAEVGYKESETGWNKLIVIKGNVNGKTDKVKYKESDDTILGYGSFYDNTDEKEDKSKKETLNEPKLGIDVSSYNGEIDWQQVKSSGVEYESMLC